MVALEVYDAQVPFQHVQPKQEVHVTRLRTPSNDQRGATAQRHPTLEPAQVSGKQTGKGSSTSATFGAERRRGIDTNLQDACAGVHLKLQQGWLGFGRLRVRMVQYFTHSGDIQFCPLFDRYSRVSSNNWYCKYPGHPRLLPWDTADAVINISINKP